MLPRTAASHALHEGLGALGDSRLLAQVAAGGGAAGLAAGAGGLGGGGGTGEDDGEGGLGIPMVEGSPEATRDIAERFAPGAPRQTKGPNPLRPAPVFGPGSLDYAGPESTDDAGSVGGSAGGTVAVAAAVATGFEPDPADRVGARSAQGEAHRTGHAPRTPGCGRASRRAVAS